MLFLAIADQSLMDIFMNSLILHHFKETPNLMAIFDYSMLLFKHHHTKLLMDLDFSTSEYYLLS